MRYHHIINPKTGYPPTITQSSSVICPTTEEGVVLSKVAFILGAGKLDGNKDISYPYYLIDSTGLSHYNDLFIPYSEKEK